MNQILDSVNQRLKRNQIYISIIVSMACFFLIPLTLIFFYIVQKGISHLSFSFFLNMPVPVGDSGGGALNSIVGSFLIIFFSGIFFIPLSVLIGIYLSENNSRLSYFVNLSINTLQGVPSIVFGIVVYILLVLPFKTFSAISASVALGLMIIPMISKATEETVSMIPVTFREAAYALGAPYYKTMFKVIIPAAKNGILSGVFVSISRITGETAPLLFTAFGNQFFNLNIFKPTNSLPLLIYNYATSPYEEWQNIAWAASLFLIIFVFFVNVCAKLVIRK